MSYLAWLDQDEAERRKNLALIDLLREKATRDELGLGGIRDAFSDLLFPGTSTVQTRARYFLFVPWIYQRLEGRKISSSAIAARARTDEVALINAVADSEGPNAGVIGIASRDALQRLPSNVYWLGLGTWRIRTVEGLQDAYHRSLDRFHRARERAAPNDPGEPVDRPERHNWDPYLPRAPRGFPRRASFDLSPTEARYLVDRITRTQDGSLLAWLVARGRTWRWCKYPWQHPALGSLPAPLGKQVEHAQCFSVVSYGAVLLYNLMLAQKRKEDVRVDEYLEDFEAWARELREIRPLTTRWDRPRFWAMARQAGEQIGFRTQSFVEAWCALALSNRTAAGLHKSKAARGLIEQRELDLKGAQARLHSQQALERWNGASAVGRLDYRWGKTQQILLDILRGLKQGKSRA